MAELNSKDLFSICRELSFGEVVPGREEEALYKVLNEQILDLCRGLPQPMQSPGIMFMMEYSGLAPGETLDFYKNYYKPVWTIIYHISKKFEPARSLTEREMETALKGQAMSLFLHSIDDHLTDGQIGTSHLMLLLRTEAWMRMTEAIESFSENNKEFKSIAEQLINEYYKGVCSLHCPKNFNEFCAQFKKEISTIYIMPLLTAKKLGSTDELMSDIKKCIASFGLAWRLIDDINDLEQDIKGEHSGLYYSLPSTGRELWDSIDTGKNGTAAEQITKIITENRIIERITSQITEELKKASLIAGKHKMDELSRQYSVMRAPLELWLKKQKNQASKN